MSTAAAAPGGDELVEDFSKEVPGRWEQAFGGDWEIADGKCVLSPDGGVEYKSSALVCNAPFVEGEVEASRVPSYIMVVDTEGTSVLTAYSGDKLNEKVVGEALKKNNVADLVKHKKLVIPGYVAVMSGKVEEETGWEVIVGPRESSMLPKFLQEAV